MTVKCPNCGTENEAGNSFCLRCGTKLTPVQQPQQQWAPPPQQPQQQYAQQPQQQWAPPPPVVQPAPAAEAPASVDDDEKPTKKRKGMFIAAIVCFAIGFLFIAVYFGMFMSIVGREDFWESLLKILLFPGGFLLTVGGILNLVSLVLSILAIKSKIKAFKVGAIVILVMSILIVLTIIFMHVIPAVILVMGNL